MRTVRAWVRPLGGAAILAVLVWRLGTGPFLDGLRTVSGRPLLAAAGLTALTTVCAAWRWTVVARGLGVGLPLRAAIAAYYRSQFLNCALPGGVLGDVHRGLRHGRANGDVGRGLRAVAWERAAGQVVTAALAGAVLLALDSPVRSAMPWVAAAAVAGGLCAALALRTAHRGPSRRARVVRAARADVRAGLLDRRAWPVVTLTSALVVAGHTGTFLIAAASTGSAPSVARMLPLAMLALLAMTVPLSLGGWGPREGVAAWAFGAAGLGAHQGVAAAAAYGALTLAATLPGALVLLRDGLERHRSVVDSDARMPRTTSRPQALAGARREGGRHG